MTIENEHELVALLDAFKTTCIREAVQTVSELYKEMQKWSFRPRSVEDIEVFISDRSDRLRLANFTTQITDVFEDSIGENTMTKFNPVMLQVVKDEILRARFVSPDYARHIISVRNSSSSGFRKALTCEIERLIFMKSCVYTKVTIVSEPDPKALATALYDCYVRTVHQKEANAT